MIGSIMMIGLFHQDSCRFVDRPSLDLLLTTCNILHVPFFFKADAFALDQVSRFLQSPLNIGVNNRITLAYYHLLWIAPQGKRRGAAHHHITHASMLLQYELLPNSDYLWTGSAASPVVLDALFSKVFVLYFLVVMMNIDYLILVYYSFPYWRVL